MARIVRDIMTRDIIDLDCGDTAREAAKLMRDRSIGNVLVTKGGKLFGIVTDRDIVVRCIAEDKDPASCTVEELCSRELNTIAPTANVDEAVALLRKHAVRRIPVVENGQPVGILSIGDLAKERDRQSALGDISAAPANR
jgi:CBS domain-containing protein